jgi:hypothetical protein
MRAVPRCRSLLLVFGLALAGAGLLAPVAGALSFYPRTDIAAGSGPLGIVVGDFNGDGRQDLATANTWDDRVSVQLGNGSGGFSVTSVAAGDGPYDLAVGDFNNDSKQDLVVVNYTEYGGLSLLTGDGVGGFTRRQILAIGTEPAPLSVTVADFNNDGNLDMAAPQYGTTRLHVLLGNGSGNFSPLVVTVRGAVVGQAADLDDDGNQDLVLTGGSGISVLMGLGNGHFGPETSFATGADPWTLVVDDLNDDGCEDLATTDVDDGSVCILLGRGDGTFDAESRYSAGIQTSYLASGDLDGDGAVDLVTSQYATGQFRVLLGDGAGHLALSTTTFAVAFAMNTTVGDFNGDGKADLAICMLNDDKVGIMPGRRETPAGSMSLAGGATTIATRSVTVGAGVTDATQMRVRNAGAAWSDWTPYLHKAPWTLASGDGTKTVEAEYRNSIGTTEVLRDSILLDTTAPQTVSDAPSGWRTGAVTVRFTASDGAGSGVAETQYKVDAATSWSTGTSVQVSGDGAHTLSYRSSDRAGNLEETQFTTVRVDATPPSASVNGVDDAWHRLPVLASFAVTDATSGVAGASFSVDGGSWTPGWSTLVSADGDHTLAYKAADNAGNESAPATVHVKIDAAAPRTTDDAPAGWVTSPPALVTLTPTDAGGSGVAATQYKLDDATSWTAGTSTSVTTDGAHTLRYRSSDVAGNVEETQEAAVRLDATAPVTTTSGDLSGWQRNPVALTFSAKDATSGVATTEYTTDGGAIWTPGAALTVAAEGVTTVGCRSTDVAGNVEQMKTAEVKIDRTAPVTTDDAPSGWLIGSPATVRLMPADAGGSGVAATQYKLDAAAAWSAGDQVVVAGDGAHTLRYRSVDEAGNVEETQFITVRVDATPPDVFISGVDEAWHTGPVFALFSATDATSGVAATVHRLDASVWTPAPGLLVATEGDHELACKATDVAGNQSAANTAHVKIDLTAPVTAVDAPAAWTNQAVTLGFSPADALSGMSGGRARTEYSLDGGVTWQQGLSATVEPDAAAHATDALAVLFRSTDNAGNAEAEESCRARIDTIRPVSFGSALAVKRGKPAKFRVTVEDAAPGSPTASVVIKISTRAGELVRTLPAVTVPTNAAATVAWAKCTLKRGTYKYVVLATDAAGNPQSKAGGNKLTVK